ncbi:MAG TPA: LysE family transporter [Candidatus Elarobacter sp.]
MESLLRGCAIGFAVAAPLGPIGVLCARRALDAGFLAGFTAGLGAASADAVYAALAAFALGVVTHVVAVAARPLHIAGAVVLIVLGARTVLDARSQRPPAAPVAHARGFATTFALTMANPMTIFSFAAIVAGAAFGAHAPAPRDAALLVAGVWFGSAAWWLILAAAMHLARHALGPRLTAAIRIASGLALAGFGVVALGAP